MKSHEKKTNCKRQPLPCDNCDETFDRKQRLRYHRRHVHGIGKPSFTCEICGKVFKHPFWLKTHIATHSNKRESVCDECGKGFKTEIQLQSHKEIHLVRSINCTVQGCDRMFGTKKLLRSHINKMHKRKDIQEFKCDQCPKKYNQNAKLKLHISVVHNGEKAFKCDICDYKAAYSNTLREHKATVHENAMFECIVPGCDKIMNRKANMDKHMNTAHGIPLPSKRNPPKKRVYID